MEQVLAEGSKYKCYLAKPLLGVATQLLFLTYFSLDTISWITRL
jgi:hypothetical protein